MSDARREAGGASREAGGARRVLVLSHTTGYQLRAFNDAAAALGIEILFATDRCQKLDDPWQDRAVAVRFHELDASVDAIVERASREPIAGVIAVGDRPVILAARAAEALGLPWHSVAGATASTDKCRSRTLIAAAGLPSPRFRILDSGFSIGDSGFTSGDSGFTSGDSGFTSGDSGFTIGDSGFTIGDSGSAMRDQGFEGFPCVLKPLGLSGSRGVIRADDPRQFEAAVRRIRALLARPQIRAARTGREDEILVEDYIPGREYALEGVLTDRALRAFAIFDKPDPLEGPFFEETLYVTPSRLPSAVQGRIVDHVQRASAALGLSHGPVHAECRITPGGEIYVLEIAARPIGGLCSRVLTLGSRSLEDVLVRHAIGDAIAGCTREADAAAVMMIPIPARGIYKGVRGEDAARAVPGVTGVQITAKVGQLLEPLPEAGSYLGFIFARGGTPAAAEASARAAHRQLTFDISRELVVRAP
jgi:biotin carboxylase